MSQRWSVVVSEQRPTTIGDEDCTHISGRSAGWMRPRRSANQPVVPAAWPWPSPSPLPDPSPEPSVAQPVSSGRTRSVFSERNRQWPSATVTGDPAGST